MEKEVVESAGKLMAMTIVIYAILLMYGGATGQGAKPANRYAAWLATWVFHMLLWLAWLPFRIVFKGAEWLFKKAFGATPKKKKKKKSKKGNWFW
ncbi:MAG TPA: hypothetical protein VI937_01115 [Negativicutes bacterium]|nr:hypothetical protein [Negativicutes bacterium]